MTEAQHCLRRASAVIWLVVLVLPGCTSFELARLRNDIARDARHLDVGEGFSVAFGRATLGLARLGAGLAGEAPPDSGGVDVAALLGSVRRVHVARYPVRWRNGATTLGPVSALERYERRGWTPLLTVREDGTETFVFTQDRRGALRQGLVVSLTATDLTLVQVRGNLDEALQALLRSSGALRARDVGAVPRWSEE